jgi:tetratricopeptide (TPR) repeat protein
MVSEAGEELSRPGEGHLSPLTMARLRSGQLEAEVIVRDVVPHLASQCPGCRAAAEAVERLKRQVGHWDEVVAVIEGTEAPELWRRLEGLGYAEQLRAVETEATFQTWGLCRLLLGMSRASAEERPPGAVRLANLAVRIAGHLGAAYHPEWVRGLRAVAFAHLGHARRALGELASAGDAFDLGARLRAGGTGSPAVEAEALALEALLERDRHRLGAAAAKLEKAYVIYRGGEGGRGRDPAAGEAPGGEAAAGDPEAVDSHLAGSALAHRAWCLYHLGRHECAARLLEEAEGLVEEEREPRLLLGIRQGRVWAAIALGRLEAATALLPAAAEVAGRLGDEAARLRLGRAEARIAAAEGRRRTAEQGLRAALRELMQLDQGVDGALTLVDLAILLLDQGATRDQRERQMAQLEGEAFTLFSAQDIQKPGMSVLLLVQNACLEHRLSRELAVQLARLLERERRPSLGWWSGSGTVLERDRSREGAAAGEEKA